MKKIAIPTRDGMVDDHFGHCDHYTICTIEGNAIAQTEQLASPQGCGCKSGIALTLAQMGVDTMLAGNMGEGAFQKLTAAGISVTRGCSGKVEDVVGAFLSGNLADSGQGCAGHSGEHKCPNHG